eukprot:CAMPEP_0170643778 /NCGR_PEP_ID=MMETSP0224-20130122/42091_1 /TAXON_ID=285029 /ORGANISM="Togula jolla, Strain CCCM 725" /LENGTH=301 /DNA_ID=CAMNT_0010974677 /DNA_START=509 /DNA_END=1411 /DNA_ORIENTATION=-
MKWDEKHAFESLFSALCDVTIYLVDSDGNNILRSHGNFDSLLQQDMQGSQLSSCVTSAEFARISKAVHVRAEDSSIAPVRLLTTTLLRQSGDNINVDMFIADRHSPLSSGYLLGMVFCSEPSLPTATQPRSADVGDTASSKSSNESASDIWEAASSCSEFSLRVDAASRGLNVHEYTMHFASMTDAGVEVALPSLTDCFDRQSSRAFSRWMQQSVNAVISGCPVAPLRSIPLRMQCPLCERRCKLHCGEAIMEDIHEYIDHQQQRYVLATVRLRNVQKKNLHSRPVASDLSDLAASSSDAG